VTGISVLMVRLLFVRSEGVRIEYYSIALLGCFARLIILTFFSKALLVQCASPPSRIGVPHSSGVNPTAVAFRSTRDRVTQSLSLRHAGAQG
jgi:hypothetical protein